jgi:hypothetical protein
VSILLGAIWFMVASLAVLTPLILRQARAQRRAMIASMESIGLRLVPGTLKQSEHFTVDLDGRSVTVHWTAAAISTGKTTVTVPRTEYRLRGFPPTLAAEPRPALILFGARDAHSTGDESFDSAIQLRADSVTFTAFARSGAREALRTIVEMGAKIANGELRLSVSGRDDLAKTQRRLDALRAFVHAFDDGLLAVPTRWLEQVESGRDVEGGLRNLLQHYPNRAETTRALELARDSLEPDVRVLVAIGTDDPGTLLAIAEHPAIDLIARARAIEGLSIIGRADRLTAAIEPSLLQLLGAEAIDIQRIAAAALAQAGTARAVAALQEKIGLFADRELERAAEKSITEIQARLGGEPGRLALVEGTDAGALSEARGGGLGVVDDD